MFRVSVTVSFLTYPSVTIVSLIETSFVSVFFLGRKGNMKQLLYIFLPLVIYIYKTLILFHWKYCHVLVAA